MADSMNIAGITADQVYQTLRTGGVADADAKLLVSNWIYQNYRTLSRTFNYLTAFPAQDLDCVPPPFARTLQHKDWVDGEDLVQAGESADDEGMNKRFHHIEGDLDLLASQIARLAACMADMRSGLRSLLDEISAELNRIDNDIGTLKGPSVVGPINVYPGVSQYAGYLPTAGTQVGTPAVNPPTQNVYPGLASDPGVRFLGTTTYQDRAVSLFNTNQGIFMMPAINASSPDTVDSRTTSVGALGQAMQDNADLKAATAGAVTKQDLVAKFGSATLSNGQTVSQALAILPDNAQYASSDALLTDMAQRIAGALQTTSGIPQQLAVAVNASPDTTSFSSVDIGGLKSLTPDATAALRAAGITTIGQVAATSPDKLTAVFQQHNVATTAGEVANTRGLALTLSNVRIG